jgi:Domain of unknown function (DUF4439)
MSAPPPAAQTAALQQALAAEHLAVYGYGAAAPQLPPRLAAAVRGGYDVHRFARDRLAAVLASAGARPVAPRPAYPLHPRPLSEADALALLAGLDDETATGYARLLAATGDEGLRRLAVGGLQASARSATTWRLAAGDPRPTAALPGLADPAVTRSPSP